jgi:hypothetical protein
VGPRGEGAAAEEVFEAAVAVEGRLDGESTEGGAAASLDPEEEEVVTEEEAELLAVLLALVLPPCRADFTAAFSFSF